MDQPSWQRVSIPVIAGERDLAVLRTVQRALPETLGEHLASIALGSQELVDAGFQVDLVPVWGPLFFAWCDETDQDPTAGDALEQFVSREALIDVRYGYQHEPLEAIVELESARSRAIESVLASGPHGTEQTVANLSARATQLLRDLYANARTGTQVDVLCPSAAAKPVHWHLDGTTCRTAAQTVDHVLVALLDGLGGSGNVIVVDDNLPIHEVRVWSLDFGQVLPLLADEARTICQPEPGVHLLDAWGV